MKLINKNKLHFENGYIMKKSKVVPIPRVVAMQLKLLDLAMQQRDYLLKQPAYQPAPTLKDFKPASWFENTYTVTKPKTPVTDKRVEEAMAFIEEMDNVSYAEDAQKHMDEFKPLLDWIADEKMLIDDSGWIGRLDIPFVGNPLELDVEEVMEVIIQLSKPITLED